MLYTTMSMLDLSILPTELINHIIPFTYQTQSRELLYDIRTFNTDFNLVQDGYVYDYDDAILLYDLHMFCNRNTLILDRVSIFFQKIIKRHFFFKTKDISQVNKFITSYGKEGANVKNAHAFDYTRKGRSIFGLLTSEERTRFINEYVLQEEDVYYVI